MVKELQKFLPLARLHLTCGGVSLEIRVILTSARHPLGALLKLD